MFIKLLLRLFCMKEKRGCLFDMKTDKKNTQYLQHRNRLCLWIHGYQPPQTPGQTPSVACQGSWEPWSRGTGLASRWCGDVTPVSAHMGCLHADRDQLHVAAEGNLFLVFFFHFKVYIVQILGFYLKTGEKVINFKSYNELNVYLD